MLSCRNNRLQYTNGVMMKAKKYNFDELPDNEFLFTLIIVAFFRKYEEDETKKEINILVKKIFKSCLNIRKKYGVNLYVLTYTILYIYPILEFDMVLQTLKNIFNEVLLPYEKKGVFSIEVYSKYLTSLAISQGTLMTEFNRLKYKKPYRSFISKVEEKNIASANELRRIFVEIYNDEFGLDKEALKGTKSPFANAFKKKIRPLLESTDEKYKDRHDSLTWSNCNAGQPWEARTKNYIRLKKNYTNWKRAMDKTRMDNFSFQIEQATKKVQKIFSQEQNAGQENIMQESVKQEFLQILETTPNFRELFDMSNEIELEFILKNTQK